MEICTVTRTRATTLPSRALDARAAGWQGRGLLCASAQKPSVTAFQGGAIVFAGMAPVTDRSVSEHLYSTRPGSPPCSPPV